MKGSDTDMRTVCTFILQFHVSWRRSFNNASSTCDLTRWDTEVVLCAWYDRQCCIKKKKEARSSFGSRLQNRRQTVKKHKATITRFIRRLVTFCVQRNGDQIERDLYQDVGCFSKWRWHVLMVTVSCQLQYLYIPRGLH